MRPDLQYAIRDIARSPGFATAAVLSIALGIGLNSMIFTFFNAIFFRPLDVKESVRVTKLFREPVYVRRRQSCAARLSYTRFPRTCFRCWDYRLHWVATSRHKWTAPQVRLLLQS
jgi:hypothetical protein